MQTVIETPFFLADAKAAGVTDDERRAIVEIIAADPEAGDVIPGTGGARKVRIGGKGKGKSGGYRVVTFYAAEDVPVFLLRLVSKGQRADISQAERNDVRATLAEDYRESTRRKVQSLAQQ
jgi:hypothetical protein